MEDTGYKGPDQELEVPVEVRSTSGAAPEGSPSDISAEQKVAGTSEVVEKYLRLAADFENYRRRAQQREAELTTEGEARMAAKLLPVLDDLERMLEAAGDREDALIQGARLIHQKLVQILAQSGLEAIDGLNQAFDPEIHRAIHVVRAEVPDRDGKVVAVAKKGYRYRGRLLRPADVIVAKMEGV